MSETRIQLIYHGPAVENGTMSAEELASALFAFVDLCHQANRVLNDDAAQVQVFVHSDFKRGSFVIDFIVNLLSQTDLSGAISQAKDLVLLLTSVINVRKLLKREKPKTVTPQPNGTQIIINNTIVVRNETFKLFKDPKFSQATEKVVKPLKNPGYDALEIKTDSDPLSTRIEKEEVDFFQTDVGMEKIDLGDEKEAITYTSPPDLVLTTDLLDQNEEIADLEIVRPSFKNGRSKWTLSDGEKTYNVQIEDHNFLNKVNKGEISFAKGDILKVRLLTETRKTSKGLKIDRRVTEVLPVVPGEREDPSSKEYIRHIRKDGL